MRDTVNWSHEHADGNTWVHPAGSSCDLGRPRSAPRPTFGIGGAIGAMRDGKRVARFGWNGPGQYLELQVPDEHSKMTLPYVYISTVRGDLVPWLASQTDLLAQDWYVVEEAS